MCPNESISSQFPISPFVKIPQGLSVEVDEGEIVGVRAPERLHRFQLTARLAYARAQQEQHRLLQKKWWTAGYQIIISKYRLNRWTSLGQISDQMEPSFHFAALERALLLGDMQRCRQHAARLEELIPGRSSRDVIEDTMDWLDEGAAPEGVVGYVPDYFLLFRHRPGELQLTLQPLEERDAHDLLTRLRLGQMSWEDLRTSSRAPVCPEISLHTGHKIWIELSLEGFWVSVCHAEGQFVFETPFPRFEEAALYLHRSLIRDLDIGLPLADGWISAA